MRFLIDMNLPPAWTDTFRAAGYEADHWSAIGEPAAPDHVLLAYAAREGYVVFTHDLDFGTLLAASGAERPSVLQVRAQNVLPAALESVVLAAAEQFAKELTSGALVTVDRARSRARVLPL